MPFATTYAVFASSAYDFICLDIAEKLGQDRRTLPGLTTSRPDHQSDEDLAIFRGMPNLVILDPATHADRAGGAGDRWPATEPVYMRLLRGSVPLVLDSTTISSSSARRSFCATAMTR